MALLRPMNYSRPENREFEWQGATDDLFDDFINPESFNGSFANHPEQRNASNDFIDFFATDKTSSSGSGSLEYSAVPSIEYPTWQDQQFSSASLSFDGKDESSRLHDFKHLSIYSRRASRSEPDLVVLPTDDVEEEVSYSHAITAPSTPRWRTRSRAPVDSPGTPLTVRKRQTSISPSKRDCAKIDKRLSSQRRVTTMRFMSTHNVSQSGLALTKRFQEADRKGTLDAKIPVSTYRLATPPLSAQFRSNSFDCNVNTDQAVWSPSGINDDLIDPMLSPTASSISNGYNRLQHTNTPADVPDDSSDTGLLGPQNLCKHDLQNSHTGQMIKAEPHFTMSTYDASLLEDHPESLSLTPPTSSTMPNGPWSQPDAFAHDAITSPSISGKAENWSFNDTGVDPTQVTCGAPATLIVSPNDAFGLGISIDNGSQGHGQGLGSNILSPGRRNGTPHHGLTNNGSRSRPMSGDYSSPALSTGLSPKQSAYSMSPLMHTNLYNPSNGLGYTYSTPPRQQHTFPHFSPTPAQMQSRQSYRLSHHHRSHTFGAPVTSIPPSMLIQPASANLSFPPMPSPSPPPMHPSQLRSPHRRSAQLTNTTTSSSPSAKHQRSRSSHHIRRKSASAASATNSASAGSGGGRGGGGTGGFVNFTPQDSKKILTGVAPSGSSKTKARREKEAAEKRRKIGEAARRAVREAGGDLVALEREVLALAGEE